MWDRIDKLLWGLVVVLAAIGGAILVLRFGFGGPEDTWLCQNNQWVKHGNPSAPMPEAACVSSDNQNLPEQGSNVIGSGSVGWNEVLTMIRNCEVLRAAQTHDRNVDLWLKDGRQVWTTEPNLDDVSKETQKATNCGIIPISTE